MAIADAIAERSKSLVPKYMQNTIDDAVADEHNEHMMKKKVLIMTNSVECSTKMKVSCAGLHQSCACKPPKRNIPWKVDKNGKEYVRDTLSGHKLNTKMVLGALAMGVGGKEIITIMAMLDLPHA
eukprot:3057015-Ditylum_brightwellii.AAC.1